MDVPTLAFHLWLRFHMIDFVAQVAEPTYWHRVMTSKPVWISVWNVRFLVYFRLIISGNKRWSHT